MDSLALHITLMQHSHRACTECKNCGDPPAAKLCQAALFSRTTAMSDTFLESWYTSLVELPLGPLTKQPCTRWHIFNKIEAVAQQSALQRAQHMEIDYK